MNHETWNMKHDTWHMRYDTVYILLNTINMLINIMPKTRKLSKPMDKVPVDVPVPHVVVVVDRAGKRLEPLCFSYVFQLFAQEEWVGDLHLPMRSQSRTFIDQVIFLILLRTNVY